MVRKSAHTAKRHAGSIASGLESEHKELEHSEDQSTVYSSSRSVGKASSTNVQETDDELAGKADHTDFLCNNSSIDIDQLLFSPNPVLQSREKQKEHENCVVNRDVAALTKDGVAESDNLGETSGRPADETKTETDFGEELFGVYPEDFNFSLDLSLCAASLEPRNLNENYEVIVPHKKDDGRDSVTGLKPEPDKQQLLNKVPVSPPVVPPHERLSSPLSSVPLDDFQFSQLSPGSNSQRESTPFNPHQITQVVNVAREQGDYPTNTFYGLPLIVPVLLMQHRGIERLYG